jgi:hypothetical protein
MTPKSSFSEPQLTVLSKRYGMSPASLSRHRSNHIFIKGHAVIHPAPPADASTLAHLEASAARLETIIAEAERNGRFDQIVTGSRELRITREAIAKAKGESNGAPVVIDLHTSEEWKAIREAVWEWLQPHESFSPTGVRVGVLTDAHASALRAELAKRLLALAAKDKPQNLTPDPHWLELRGRTGRAKAQRANK